MKLTLICYCKYTTCQKAKTYLDVRDTAYELRDIKLNNPTREELKAWLAISGLPSIKPPASNI
jgi:arsenate reductase (glutaredoxin)